MSNRQGKNSIPVGVLGATGMVGRQFVRILADHPWFRIECLAASERNRGRSYADAAGTDPRLGHLPEAIAGISLLDASADLDLVARKCRLVFSALAMDKQEIRSLETRCAALGLGVISNNSAHRWTDDVPVIIPEINPQHSELISIQRKKHGWKTGFIVVKPNCSVQCYLPVLEAVKGFGLKKAIVATYQAVSGAGRNLSDWPEMQDNVIPFIPGEEEKSEREPLKIWGKLENGRLHLAEGPEISSTCVRVPVTDGHLAVVHAGFEDKPTREQFLDSIRAFSSPLKDMNLPSSPKSFIRYFEEEDRPQTRLDRDLEKGMGICMGRLRQDTVLDWKFVTLSHNTLRGAAGGGVLTAELLVRQGFVLP